MRLTGSGFARAEACTPSTFLPGVDEPVSQHAKAGSAVHRYLCLVAEVGAESALELIEEEYRDLCAVLDLEALPHSSPEAWAVEVAYAWDYIQDTARELYRGSGARDYGDLAPSEVPGTADLVGLDGDTVIVLDLKTGWKPLGPPAESMQLGFYAVAAARALGATKALVGFVRLRDGAPRYEYATLDELDLEAMAERLRGVVSRVGEAEADWLLTGQPPTLRTGDHCEFCPVFLCCPAKATLVRELAVQAASSDPAELTPVLNAEDVPQALERLWAAQDVLSRVEKTLKEYAATNPVHLPDGSVYGAIEASEETLDPVIGEKVIAARFGEHFAAQCVETKVSLTKSAIKRVLQPLVKDRGDKWAPTERAVLEEIRAAGGSRVSIWPTVKVFKPKLLK